MSQDTKDLELMDVLKKEIDKLTQKYEKIIKIRDARERQELQIEVLGQLSIFLAHEIRNPLGGILLYAELLRKSLADDPEKKEIAEKIIDCVSRLNILIQNMLTFGRELNLNRFKQPIRPIIESSIEQSASRLANKKINVEKEINELYLNCDGFWMERVFSNIINNAIDAMNEGGVIEIKVSKEGKLGVISFRDNGPGLSEHDFQNLFNVFYTTKKVGSGLGLAIVSMIIKAHGGRILAFNNKTPDGSFNGAVFRIEIESEA